MTSKGNPVQNARELDISTKRESVMLTWAELLMTKGISLNLVAIVGIGLRTMGEMDEVLNA